MLTIDPTPALTEFDHHVFALVVPPDHYLRQVVAHIDFERFRLCLAETYSLELGRPPIPPLRMLKIMFLRFHYKLSDYQVMARTTTDMAFRWFLGLPVGSPVPHPSNGTYFRQRLGAERFMQVFQDLITQAREAGLIKDRLRLKDATHLLADVANVQPLQLVAQVRDRLLQAATPLWADWVGEQRAALATLQQTTAEFTDEERLAARVEHLQQLAAQVQDRLAQPPVTPATAHAHQRLRRALDVADKLLADCHAPAAHDQLASAVDTEARVGKHGSFFVGYKLDLLMDADSELITSLNVLPGNGAEAADAIVLLKQEEAAQGNDVAALSMDGAGYNGPLLRELSAPQGLHVDVTVPPPAAPPRTTFGPERFPLTVLAAERSAVTCPNGQTTQQRSRTRHDTGFRYQFAAKQCAGCPLRSDCLENPASKRGRVVVKNDYEAEYQQVAAKAQTPQYQETRRIHPKVERKLNEVVRHHGARRVCFRGQAKVLIQAVLTTLVVNVKRMLKLLTSPVPTELAAQTVRAELGCT